MSDEKLTAQPVAWQAQSREGHWTSCSQEHYESLHGKPEWSATVRALGVIAHPAPDTQVVLPYLDPKKSFNAFEVCDYARAAIDADRQSRAQPSTRGAELREWLRDNMTFFDAGGTGAALASVSKRIWYHATDDVTSYPFDEVAAAALDKAGS